MCGVVTCAKIYRYKHTFRFANRHAHQIPSSTIVWKYYNT